MKCYIYGLSSSEDGVIRYVGKTKNDIFTRMIEHKCDALTKKMKSHKCNWIRKIYDEGFELQVLLIEETDDNNWQDREIYWIKKYREKGNLVNQLDGGESGGIGGKLFPFSYDETKSFLKENFLCFKNYSDYKRFLEKNTEYKSRLPVCPKKIFKKRNEWISWGDFLGTKYVSDKEKNEKKLSYDDAKKILKENRIDNRKKYKEFIKNEKRLPVNPWNSYAGNGWVDCYDFFSKRKIKKCDYETFKRYIKITFKKPIFITFYEQELKTGKYSKRLPFHPDRKFKKRWTEIIKDIF